MNTLQMTTIRAPSGKDDTSAMLVIDNVNNPFVFHDITEVGKEYTFSFYICSESDGEISINGDTLATTSDWTRYENTFTANSSNILIYFNVVGTYYIYNSQLEIGNQVTDYRPCPDDVEEKFTNYSTTSKVESMISVSKESILQSVSETYVTTTTYNGLSGQVTSLESWQSEASLLLTKDGIVGIVGSYYTTLDDINVGGTNLIPISTLTEKVRLDYTGGNFSSIYSCVTDYISVNPNEDLVFTVYGTHVDEGDTYWQIAFYDENQTFISRALMEQANTTKEKTSWNFTTPDNASYVRVGFPISAKENVKLEYGNIATYWSPCPEDTETRLTVAESRITQNAESITLRVEKNGVISAINQTSETITIDASKINLSGYVTMSNLATAGETIIDGANITTGYISADRIAALSIDASKITVGNWLNYSDLNINTCSKYGFTATVIDETNNPWFKMNTLKRDTNISPETSMYNAYTCEGGETYLIKFEVISNAQVNGSYVNINVGIYAKTRDGSYRWHIPYCMTSDASGEIKYINTYTTIDDDDVSFAVYVQVDGAASGEFTGEVYIRNISVSKMTTGELIVNGSITADKIDVDDLFAQEITATNLTVTGNSVLGGWSVSDTRIKSSSSIYIGAAEAGFMIMNETNQAYLYAQNSSGTSTFQVTRNGYLQATGASISGTINATTLNATDNVMIVSSADNKSRVALSSPSTSATNLNIGTGFSQVTCPKLFYASAGMTIIGSIWLSDGTIYSTGSITSATSLKVNGTSAAHVVINNSIREGHFQISSAGNLGIYDTTNTSWVIYSDNSANICIGGKCIVPTSGAAGVRSNGDNTYACGHTSYRWTYVYAASGVSTTSDEREKDILDLDLSEMSDYFMSLKPIAFRWNYGTDRKIRFGLGAQTSERKLSEAGYDPSLFAMIQHDDLEEVSATGLTERYGMNYQELQMLTMMQTQKTTREFASFVVDFTEWKGTVDTDLAILINANESLNEQVQDLREKLVKANQRIEELEEQIA